MGLDQVMMEGVNLRVRRPNDYNPAVAATLGPSGPSPALNLAAIGLTPVGLYKFANAVDP
jgi:splicing factor U2AF subunit